MPFPDESVRAAKEIAARIRARADSQRERASLAYGGAFLELGYGFSDAVRSGKCGTYLHEARREVECYSKGGIDYLITRELGLKPKFYWLTDTIDVGYGDDPSNMTVADHLFISVMINNEEWAYDSNLATFKKMKVLDDKIILQDRSRYDGNESMERWFTTLEVLTEEQYLSELENLRRPQGGKKALAAGQTIRAHNERITVQYIPDTNSLLTFYTIGAYKELEQSSPSKTHVLELIAPVGEDGTWLLDEGMLNMYLVKQKGWRRDQHVLPHLNISIPYCVAKRYIEDLESAAQHFGRKTSITKLRSKDRVQYFKERGFAPTGEIILENGIDRHQHQLLLDQILFSYDSEPEEIKPYINQEAAYTWLSLAAESDGNPQGLLYTKEQRDAYIREWDGKWMDLLEEKKNANHDIVWARSGLGDHLTDNKRKAKALGSDENKSNIFREMLNNRRADTQAFDVQMDYALYQREHPLGSVQATEDQIRTLYMCRAHDCMIYYAGLMPILEGKQYQPGLKRILA